MLNDKSPRDRGIITDADRAFLCGETKYQSNQSTINTKRRIRDRVYHSLLDFIMLFEFMEAEDRNQVFSRLLNDRTVSRKSLESMIAFAYAGLENATDSPDFEPIIENGVDRAIRREKQRETGDVWSGMGLALEVDLTVHRRYLADFDLNSFYNRLDSESVDELSDADLRNFTQLYAMSEDPTREGLREQHEIVIQDGVQELDTIKHLSLGSEDLLTNLPDAAWEGTQKLLRQELAQYYRDQNRKQNEKGED